MTNSSVAADVSAEIRSYVVDRFLFGQGADGLSNADSFLERSLVDSTGILELVAFLEGRYGIKVLDEELVPENLDSIDRAAAFVARKQAQS
jgi:acyl carrier protein